MSVESELLSTFSENLCQPLPAEILPGRPLMLTSTLVSLHADGSGSGDSGSEVVGAGEDGLAEVLAGGVVSGAEVLGGGVVSGAEVLGGGVVSGAEVLGGGVVSEADSLTDVLGAGDVSSLAYAAGAASSATGAMTAVAAAAAIARRSFMKTSESPAYHGLRYELWGRPPRVGRGCGPWFGRFDP
ncbi:hypothetical protein GCM10010384_03740 [Streptomyces djakartensis]|uniref:Uncharacterized protein n=1 Tax=Streptomyces djakartensis TaxID=68193 RepID=A0ABQ2Z4F2_9ACTN|nr:hypothetical protein GCM10010384_03740 [Streptomyces djakartensis]